MRKKTLIKISSVSINLLDSESYGQVFEIYGVQLDFFFLGKQKEEEEEKNIPKLSSMCVCVCDFDFY